MKKLLLGLIAAIAVVMASCTEKTPNATQVKDNVYSVEVEQEDGSVGYTLAQLENDKYQMVDKHIYLKFEYDEASNIIKAYKTADLFDMYKADATPLRNETAFKSLTVEGEVIWLKDENAAKLLYVPKTGYLFGPYRDIFLCDNLIIFYGLKAYGMYDMDYNYLIEAKYDNIYIVNRKSEKEYDVLLCEGENWTLQNALGKAYPGAKTSAVLSMLQKKFKPEAPCGELPLKY